MAEAAKVRLVRCPKCENLLQELPDFSLYQCGGCGAVLKATQKGILEDGLAEISDAVKARGISEEDRTDKVLEVKMERDDNNIEGPVLEKARKNGIVSNGSSTSRAESTEARVDSDTTRRGKERIRKLESFDSEYASYHQGPASNRNQHSNLYVDGPEYVKDIRPPPMMDSLRSRPVVDQWGVKMKEPTFGPARGVPAQMRFDDYRYYDEGQSSYETGSYCEPGEKASRYQGQDTDGLSRIDNLDIGRAELIRRLDELKDQISRSCDITDKSKERIIYPDPYGRRQAPDDVAPTYFSDPHGYVPTVPYTNRYNPHGPDPYPERRHPHEFRHYANNNNNAYKPEIPRRPPSGPQSQYAQHHPYHEHFPSHYGADVNHHDLFTLHRHENFFHQPACSCAYCCDKNWHMPLPKPVNPPPGLHIRRSGPQKSLSLNSNDLDSENDGFNHNRPRKLVMAHRSGRLSRPIAGGSPFIACSNCYEILKLPKKCVMSGESQQKLKCGACSSIILFELGNKGFIASSSAHVVDQVPSEIDEGSSGTLDENMRYWNDGLNSGNLNNFSNDYDDFGHKKSNSGLLLSASGLSEDEESPKNELPGFNEVKPSPDTDLSSENITVNHFDKGNKSQRPEEHASLDRTTSSQQRSVKDGSPVTELDVSLNEFSNSCASQDSVEISKEANKTKSSNKGSGESFFAGLIKRSFIKDLKKSNAGVVEAGGDSQVFINGHFIPDRMVKKAEKSAGPIKPGEYWYDKRGGFWGVMGHPCLGIIMPNIEEFNYPLPEKCAAGNTGVCVNGRELHQKDLDLLASRGLPITKHRSYLVEITGKVIDEQTGQELDGLGKLAPTVERAKHGFGMKTPRSIAQSKK